MMLNPDQSVQDLVKELEGKPVAPRPGPASPEAGKAKKRRAGTMLGVAPQIGELSSAGEMAARGDSAGEASASKTDDSAPSDAADSTASELVREAAQGLDESPRDAGTPPIENSAKAGAPDEPASRKEPASSQEEEADASSTGSGNAATLPPESQPSSEKVSTSKRRAGRVTLLEALLILATLGVYGIVLLARERRRTG